MSVTKSLFCLILSGNKGFSGKWRSGRRRQPSSLLFSVVV